MVFGRFNSVYQCFSMRSFFLLFTITSRAESLQILQGKVTNVFDFIDSHQRLCCCATPKCTAANWVCAAFKNIAHFLYVCFGFKNCHFIYRKTNLFTMYFKTYSRLLCYSMIRIVWLFSVDVVNAIGNHAYNGNQNCKTAQNIPQFTLRKLIFICNEWIEWKVLGKFMCNAIF